MQSYNFDNNGFMAQYFWERHLFSGHRCYAVSAPGNEPTGQIEPLRGCLGMTAHNAPRRTEGDDTCNRALATFLSSLFTSRNALTTRWSKQKLGKYSLMSTNK